MSTIDPINHSPAPVTNGDVTPKKRNTAVNLSQAVDLIPIASTISGIVKLVIKGFKLPKMNPETIKKSDVLSQINKTETWKYVVMLLPVIGNIIIVASNRYDEYRKEKYIADFGRRHKDDFNRTPTGTITLGSIPSKYQGDPDIVLAAVRRNGISEIPEELKSHREFMLKAIALDPGAFEVADAKLKADKDFLLDAIKKNNLVFRFPEYQQFKNNTDFILEVMNFDPPTALQEFADEELKKNLDFARRVLDKNPNIARMYLPKNVVDALKEN